MRCRRTTWRRPVGVGEGGAGQWARDQEPEPDPARGQARRTATSKLEGERARPQLAAGEPDRASAASTVGCAANCLSAATWAIAPHTSSGPRGYPSPATHETMENVRVSDQLRHRSVAGTATGGWSSTARWRRSSWPSTPDAGLRDDYELKLNSYDLGVDIELYDAVQRLRFEHPEVKAVVVTGGLDKVFCAGANIQMLAGSTPRPQGQLLQVHQRDAQRHRGRHRQQRPDVDRRGQRHRRGRRVRAGAGVRRDPARRRSLVGRVAARGAAARRAARARAGSRGSSTSATSAATSPTCSPPEPRASRASRRSSGASSTRSPRASRSTSSSAKRALERAAHVGPPDDVGGHARSPRCTARSTATRSATSTSPSTLDRTLGAADDHRRRTDRSQPTTADELAAAGASAWVLAAVRQLDDAILGCGSTSRSSAHGCCARTATPSASSPPRTCSAERPLAGPRGAVVLGAHAEAPRRLGPHARRPDRARELLRRHARRAGARRRPHADAGGTWEDADDRLLRRCASRRPTTAGTRWRNG